MCKLHRSKKIYRNGLKIILVLFLLLNVSLSVVAQTIRVAVAADAQFVAQALKKSFEKKNHVNIEIIIGSSGKLTAQIEQGAPYDIFLSADMKYPETLYKNGNTIGKPRIYALGELVLWTIKKINMDNGFRFLKQPSIKTIAIANPAIAPYGVAAIESLTKAGIFNAVKSKIVYGESIAQVNQYLLSGVADVAFTAKSVVESPGLKNKGTWIELQQKGYHPIAQGVVILKHAKLNHFKAATDFYSFLFSPAGKTIFRSFGYHIK